jgi:hydroxymethylpyrimidine kinase/phosphomethylpyrimidine kinase
MNAFGVHGCSAITAITAQNTQQVFATEMVSEEMLRAQLEALETDLPAAAIKTGMLGNVSACKMLSDFFQHQTAPVVCDPVLKSTSGADLLSPAALEILIHGVFPHVKILTPNLPEAAQLIGRDFQHSEDAAELLLETGVQSVLIKGGHAEGGECRDYWTDGAQSMWLSSPRIKTTATHGTGCILSSAIASALALGQTIPEALTTAKTFLNQCLKSPTHIGGGHGPMRIESFRNDPADRPTLAVGGVGDPATATEKL